MSIKLKKNIKKSLENKYEFRFYKYLVFILLILFSCIITVSSLINPTQARKIIAMEVRLNYNDFFTYEIDNSYKGLEYVYDTYSSENNICIEKLMAINIIYFGQDENRYLEPYIRGYIDNKTLYNRSKKNLYISVNRETQSIENSYVFKIVAKRFLPYVLAIIFVTSIMFSISFMKKRKAIEKIIFGIILFIMGAFICYLSFYSFMNGILLSIAIVGATGEFTIGVECKSLKWFECIFLFVILSIILLASNNNTNNSVLGCRNSELFLVDNLENKIGDKKQGTIQALGNNLLNELKKSQMIEINIDNSKMGNLLNADNNRLVFKDNITRDNVFFIYFYKDIPVYRFVCVNGYTDISIYEGVFNPYMRSIITKLDGKYGE